MSSSNGRVTMLLNIDSLTTSYGSIRVLSNVSLSVERGEIVVLVGANGAGKTTLLRTISGLLRPEGGSIAFNGMGIAHADPADIVKAGISHIPEHRQLFGDMTVHENLLLGAYQRYRAGGKKAIDEDLQWVYALFPRLEERNSQLAETMSGGEQQMLAIGRGMMARPELMLFDEPSLGLAPVIASNVFEIISELRSHGMTVLLVEQNANAALKLSDRGYVLETGEIVLEGSSKELLDNPRVQEAYLGGP
jgi:branched-chain amino acid transport system ATP-binding protein